MKAQLSLEYYISLTIFIGFIVYISFQVMRISPQFITEVENERLKSEAYQISELLINDAGEPLNWENNPSSVERIGLSKNYKNETNLLSQQKITAFNTTCNSDYGNVRRSIGTDYYFSLELIDISSGQSLIDCNPPIIFVKPAKVVITRITALDSPAFGELILQLW